MGALGGRLGGLCRRDIRRTMTYESWTGSTTRIAHSRWIFKERPALVYRFRLQIAVCLVPFLTPDHISCKFRISVVGPCNIRKDLPRNSLLSNPNNWQHALLAPANFADEIAPSNTSKARGSSLSLSEQSKKSLILKEAPTRRPCFVTRFVSRCPFLLLCTRSLLANIFGVVGFSHHRLDIRPYVISQAAPNKVTEKFWF